MTAASVEPTGTTATIGAERRDEPAIAASIRIPAFHTPRSVAQWQNGCWSARLRCRSEVDLLRPVPSLKLGAAVEYGRDRGEHAAGAALAAELAAGAMRGASWHCFAIGSTLAGGWQ